MSDPKPKRVRYWRSEVEKQLVADRNGLAHDPLEVAEELDAQGDRSSEAVGEALHDAADVMRGLMHLVETQKKDVGYVSSIRERAEREKQSAEHRLLVNASLERRLRLHEDLLGLGTPWPLEDVLRKLVSAADHLLGAHDCDGHGYEETQRARHVAMEIVHKIEMLRKTKLEEKEGK